MATLADSFLQDLASLEQDEDFLENEQGQTTGETNKNAYNQWIETEYSDEIVDAIQLYEKLQHETSSVVSNLASQPDFVEFIAKVREVTADEPQYSEEDLSTSKTRRLHPDELKLLTESNSFIAKLDIEILNIYSFVRDLYSKKFPELESIVISPLEYIAVVQRIKNETDLTIIELGDILPNTITMAVTVASSMTTGFPLPPLDLEKVLKACEEAIHLAERRKTILEYLESRMDIIAPNVSAIIGSALAARLITHAQGITQLARMPSQNIMLIGASSAPSKSITGPPGAQQILGGATTSTSGAAYTRSIIYNCNIVQMTPIHLRNRALKLVAGKLGLAARVDSFHESPNGAVGRALREHILRALLKAQEPPPAPIKKALPVPDEAPKSRRGGKRYRHSKEKFKTSEFRKQANRLNFGPEAEEEYDLEAEVGLGLLNKDHGHLKLQSKQMKLQAKRQKKFNQKAQVIPNRSANAPSSGATAGMSSSLAFTPFQGIELCTTSFKTPKPLNLPNQNEYFSSAVVFNKVDVKPAS